MGLSITIPLAMLSDFLIFGSVPSGMAFGGAALVLLGFVCVAYRQENNPNEGNNTNGTYRLQNESDISLDRVEG